jgi:endonuclease III
MEATMAGHVRADRARKELAMATPSQDAIITALLQRHGRTFADELGIDLHSNTPASLFRLLCAALLFSARIRASTAAAATKALAEQGWTTPHKLVESTWEQRARVLNRAGYARYDERTATMLGDTAQLLIDRYAGDLRNLRAAAERRPEQERVLLKQFKGIGDVGADIFLREVQAVWDEVRPFVDRRARAGAKMLGLPHDPQALARLVASRDFPRLVAALLRVELADDADAVLAQARQAQA